MIPILLLLAGTLAFTVPPSPPDSLFSKVVIFKKGTGNPGIGLGLSWGSPLATGFYLDTGNVRCAFFVTARHVLRIPDSVAGLRVHIVNASGHVQDEYLGDYRVAPSVMTHPDFWTDIALLTNHHPGTAGDSLSGFCIDDIVTPEEFRRMSRGSQVFYIGMCLDSIMSARNVYSFPVGTWLSTFEPQHLLVDSTHRLAWRADFALKIPGSPGISGSPVLVKDQERYRLIGIVNGFGVDALGRLVDTAYCTAAYRILETLQESNNHRNRKATSQSG
jgi:hypothetical protein